MRKSVVSLPPSRRCRHLVPALITTLLLSLLLYRWSGAVQLPTLSANASFASCLTLANAAAIPAPNQLLTFDDLPVNTIIGNSYKPNFGVAFENSSLKTSKVITFTDGINTTNVATGVITPSITNDDRRLVITFDSPQTHVGLLVGNGEPGGQAQWRFNPVPETALAAGDTIVAIVSPEGRRLLEAALAAPAAR